jgi:Predicted metal-binding protein related to the C-terminal domain of SecA
MSLLNDWEQLASQERTQEEYDKFWKEYLEKEKKIYEGLLSEKNDTINGRFSELAEKFGMSSLDFAGFMSGINTSLIEPADVEGLTESSEIDIKIDFEKLYYNMHAAEADWLYNLPEWDGILSKEKRKEIKTAYNRTKTVVKGEKIGRNDPCPCGSGKKYKKCCGAK